MGEPGNGPGRVGDRDLEALGVEKFGEPAAHLAAAANHQRWLARTLTLCPDPRLFLVRQGRTDQQAQQRLGEVRGDSQCDGEGPGLVQHQFLPGEVPGGAAGGPLEGPDLARQSLPLGHERQDLPVDCGQLAA